MSKKERDKLKDKFKAECSDHAAAIDGTEPVHWHTLTFGWGIAKGLTIDEAHKFATYIRYSTDLA